MSKLLEKLNHLKNEYKNFMEKNGEDIVKELFKEFFDACPEIESINFKAYTDYFNDGEPCHYYLREFYVTFKEENEEELNTKVSDDTCEQNSDEDCNDCEDDDDEYNEDDEDDDDDDEYDSEELDSWSLKSSDDERRKQIGELLDTLEGSLPTDLAEYVFGDHVHVTVTRDGIQTEDYSNHD